MKRFVVPTSIAFIFLATALGEFVSAAEKQNSEQQVTTSQLPRNVRPTHYDVSLTPDAKAMTFAGKAVITISVLQETDRITLNNLELTFTSVALSPRGSNITFDAPTIDLSPKAQTATLVFAKVIPQGQYLLEIHYTGKIGTQAVGLFALDYDTKDGKKRALYTQFENSDARRVIPCWDEPAYKATFTLDVTAPSNAMVVSNMPVERKAVLGNDRTHVQFMRTPTMSTYLLFFAQGDFDRTTASVGKTEVGVITQKGAASQAAFALQASQAVLREYNDYFGTPFPLPKLDNIAAPGSSTFFGAMENWGTIFSFEQVMLLEPAIANQRHKEEIFTTAAHEIAHQWFGDLVTMSWWDDIWLNEGFASWMEARTTMRLHPEWKSSLWAVGGRNAAMSRDALATTHAVVQHVETVEQASQAFDSITYQKGAAVINMLESYVGDEAWRTGVRRYIKAHAHANTVSDDLWREVQAAANKPIMAIAHDFTLQPGVPLIRVGEPLCKDGRTTVQLTQSEFSKDQPNKAPLRWHVPVIARVLPANKSARVLVSDGNATMTLPGCGTLIVNAGQTGYYRTLYTPAHFQQLAKHFASIDTIDQLGIMVDTNSQGLVGLQSAADILELINAIPLTADPQVWSDAATSLDGFDTFYNGEPSRQAVFRQHALATLAPIFSQVGWVARPGELYVVANLRSRLVSTLNRLGDQAVIAEARRRYAAQGTDATAIPADLRKTILAVVARHADAALWDQLHAAAIAEKTPLVKQLLYSMLAVARDDDLAHRALELALTSEPGATISAGMIGTVAQEHPDMAFEFAIAHLSQVDNLIDGSSKTRYYAGLATSSSDPKMIGKIRAYADANLAPSSRRAADSAIANIAYRIKVKNEKLPLIDAWLASKERARQH